MRNSFFKVLSLVLSSAIIVTSVCNNNLEYVYAKTEEALVEDIETSEESEVIEEALLTETNDASSEKSEVGEYEINEYSIVEDTIVDSVGNGIASEIEESASVQEEPILDVNSVNDFSDEDISENAEIVDNEESEATEEQQTGSDSEPENEPSYIVYEDGSVADVTYGYKDTGYEAPFSYYAEEDESSEAFIPDSYDSRKENGYVTSVKDQNPYGSCWSFSAMAAMEASMMANGYVSNPDYSEAHLVWMFYNLDHVNDPQGNTYNDRNMVMDEYYPTMDLRTQAYDIGGNVWEYTITLSKWLGAASEEDYTYSNESTPTVINNNSKDDAKNTEISYSSVAHLQNARMIGFSQPNEIKKAIMSHGTVGMNYCHYDQFYYSNKQEKIASYYLPISYSGVNHEVAVVGWDDNYSRNNFHSYYNGKYYQPKTDGAWLVKNNWGTSWGNDGYFWISYADGSLSGPNSRAYACVIDAEPVNNYDNNYFYDGGNADVKENEAKAVANVFTANQNEELEAMSIMLGASDVDYSIQVYLNPNADNPESGTPMLTTPQVGKTNFSGYYTIPLDETVSLNKGDSYSIVFKSNKLINAYYDTSVDWRYGDSNGYYDFSELHISYAKRQQSYSYNGKWKDLNAHVTGEEEEEGYIIRMHAFTNNKAEGKNVPTSIDFLNIKDNSLSLSVGDYYDIKTKMTYDSNDKKPYDKVVWSVSDASIASVDSLGHLVAKKSGQTTVTATSKADNSIRKSVNVFVFGDVSVTLDGTSKVGNTTVLLYDFDESNDICGRCNFNPEGYTPQNIKWFSSNEKVLTFVSGTDNDKSRKAIIHNPGRTVVSVVVDGVTMGNYSISVLPDFSNPELKASLDFSGEIDINWSGSSIAKGYRIKDNANKVIYSCNANMEADYSYTSKAYIGKMVGNKDIVYKLAAVYDYYDTSTKVKSQIADYDDTGILTISGSDFDNREIKLKYVKNYPVEGIVDADVTSIPVSYKDNVDFAEVDAVAKYEFDGWKVSEDTIFRAGDSINDEMHDCVIWSSDKEYNYEYELNGQWSQLKVGDVKANLASGTYDCGTRLKLTTDTPGAKIYYTIDGTDVDVSGQNKKLYEGFVELDYSTGITTPQKNITIKAKAVKDGYYDSAQFNVTMTVRALGYEWGDVPEGYFTQPTDVPTGIWAHGYSDQVYSGTAITFPDLEVYYHKVRLTEGKDYSVKYSNNISANEDYEGPSSLDSMTAAQQKKLPCITITGKGDYSGSSKVFFAISPLDINDNSIVIANAESTTDDKYLIYTSKNNKEQKILPLMNRQVASKNVSLKNKSDYELVFDPENEGNDFIEKGLHKVKINGKGNYTGSRYYYVNIVEAVVMSAASVSKIANRSYTGEAVSVDELSFTVKSGKTILKRATSKDEGDGNYYATISGDCTNSGTVKVTLTGTGESYNDIVVEGSKTVTFNIVGTSMKKVLIELPKSVAYKGKPWKVGDDGFSVSIKNKDTGSPLVEGTDYTVNYTKNENAGTATIEFTGIKAYEGSVKKTFKITPYNLNDSNVSAKLIDQPGEGLLKADYAKKGSKPQVKVLFELPDGSEESDVLLKEGKDYKLSYLNNGAVNDASNPKKMPTVKITGMGNFTGINTSLVYEIVQKDISDIDEIKISATDTFGGKYNSVVTLLDVDSDNAKLKAGTDYDKNITYTYVADTEVQVKSGKTYVSVRRGKGSVVRKTDIIPAGTQIRASVTGKNNYKGVRSVVFKVSEYNISKANIQFNKKFVVNGKAIEPDYDDMVITFKGITEPLKSSDYEIVEYTNNTKAGNATVTIRGLGAFGGTKTVKFKINSANIK